MNPLAKTAAIAAGPSFPTQKASVVLREACIRVEATAGQARRKIARGMLPPMRSGLGTPSRESIGASRFNVVLSRCSVVTADLGYRRWGVGAKGDMVTPESQNVKALSEDGTYRVRAPGIAEGIDGRRPVVAASGGMR
ncbi:hypothetical protein AMJ39_08580 [candidate division TA06 bacterium DG_24]|uniref:Uncharacterized protein n=2 Tax=Bacteria division TA06 TaxID=1156500 RepID=A0A0S8G5I5_UNCT6|nr:MAG: hypothetical protein AMJ39_08580 [candidate division TA06 bacterium DG_24]KPK68323.1 MAG: hypothetical protein AMJ82_08555 [candidate division TA06 bacterium SM23_40]